VNDKATVRGGRARHRSPAVEEALQELAHLPVTEACASGSCDICLNQTGPCDVVGPQRGNSHPFRQSEKKTK